MPGAPPPGGAHGDGGGGNGGARLPPLVPDAYTYNALLCAAAQSGVPLAALEALRAELAAAAGGSPLLNAHTGVSLVSALRCTPELARAAEAADRAAARARGGQGETRAEGQDAAAAAAGARVVAAAEGVLAELTACGVLDAGLHMQLAALYATARRPSDVLRCVRRMLGGGLLPEEVAWRFLAQIVEDAALHHLLPSLAAAREQAAAAAAAQRQRAAAAQAAQGRGPPGAGAGLDGP
jgi:hypothetical protein